MLRIDRLETSDRAHGGARPLAPERRGHLVGVVPLDGCYPLQGLRVAWVLVERTAVAVQCVPAAPSGQPARLMMRAAFAQQTFNQNALSSLGLEALKARSRLLCIPALREVRQEPLDRLLFLCSP